MGGPGTGLRFHLLIYSANLIIQEGLILASNPDLIGIPEAGQNRIMLYYLGY